MKCPVCKRDNLRKCQLETDLPAYQCKKCEGVWISAVKYWKWLKTQNDDLSEPSISVDTPLPVEEVGQAKLCPGCGHILRRYKVWPDVKFYLDRCGHCSSVWFDRDEWAALKSRDLHDQVHIFFSDLWQEKLGAEESRGRLEKIYLDRFGAEDYGRLKEIRKWLDGHPQRGALLAYLSDRDPYRAISDSHEEL
ncbi:MAG: zf-TFIIB domain-containing protein [Chloroflexota bacterium]|nr:zf-TFIIB domain-containing protein [Chloroflexota bacterium]